jgi:predicted permease
MMWRQNDDLKDLDRELRAHLDAEAEEQCENGVAKDEARFAAQRALGNVAIIKDDTRRAWGWVGLEQFLQDVRYGARMIRKSPVFTAVAIFSLALGIGANIGIFSLMDAVLFRPLPVEKPHELEKFDSYYSFPMYRELRDANTVFSGLIARQVSPVAIVTSAQPQRATAELVSGNYFSVLGIQPLLGRMLTPDDDDAPMKHPVAVLSYIFWRDHFSSDPNIAGKTFRINDYPFTIVGVAPPTFYGVQAGTSPDVWTPLMTQPRLFRDNSPVLENTGAAWLNMIGRRAPGVNEQQALAGLNVTFHQLVKDGHHKLYRGKVPGRENLHLFPGAAGFSRLEETYGDPLYLLMAVVALVLLIACVNIASLLLARSAARRREIAVRLALGAGRFRLVRQLLTESLSLAVLGGILGVVFARWSVALLIRFLPTSMSVGDSMIPLSLDVQMNARVLVFAVAVTIVTGILFGLVPAIQATRPDVSGSLKDEGASLSAGPPRLDLGKLLVISQVTLSLVLLVGAGLFLQSLRNVSNVDAGVNTENVVQASMNPDLSGYPAPQITTFFRQLQDRLQNLPNVESVATTAYPLFSGTLNGAGLLVPGRPAPSDYHDTAIMMNFVGGDFFRATGTRLLRGRSFLPTDTGGSPLVIIITETAAKHFFPREEAIGKKVRFGGHDGVEIIGIAADAKYDDVREDTPRIAYVSFDQSPTPVGERTVYVRAYGNPLPIISGIRREVQALDSSLPIYGVKTFAQQKLESLAPERLLATLSTFFGALALLLASIGLYGVMASSVQRRTREIGIRMSLGASRSSVLRMVMRSCLLLAGAGIIAGVAISLMLAKLMTSLLFGVPPRDPLAIAAAAFVLIIVAGLAGYIPARRASRVDPIIALRYE